MSVQDQSQEVLHFDSNMSGWMSSMKTGEDQTMHIAQTSDTNDAFLGRPVKILTQPWKVGEDLHITFDPWSLFFENSKVINRIAHFKNMRATLNVKFQLNGSPFYYGRMMAAYHPLPNSDSFTANRDDVAQDKIAASQRPKVFLDPTTNQGGTIVCPFIWPKNTLDIPSMEWNKMGNITLYTLNGLQHANASTDTLTITAFAYCSDYDLSTPTSQLPSNITPQMGSADEYGKVSGPAHTIANWSGKLSNAPVIGPYARATEMIASSVGNIASLFGFSKPRAIDQSRCLVTGDVELACTNIPDNSMTLALDAKKEITVDPTVTGAGNEDEMAIVPLACKESYIATFPWDNTLPSDVHLFSIRVRPTQGDVNGDLVNPEIHMTPSSWVSLPFEYWTGSMDFRFQIVCSAYHRGRLRFVWDPDFYSGNDYNTNYSQIVDISNARDFKMRVGWGANTSYLPVSDPLPATGNDQSLFPSFSSIAFDSKEKFSNGTLSVFVVNELTSPDDSGSTVEVNVFTNMAEDFEVAGPTCSYVSRFAALDGLSENSDPQNPRNPGGNPPPDTGPVDAPTPDNDNNNSGASPDDLVLKSVNPFGVLRVDPASVVQGQSRPFTTPQYSNQIGVAADRAFLLGDGLTELQLYGRGEPNPALRAAQFTFNNPSANARTITITTPAGVYTGTLNGNIGASVTILAEVSFSSPDASWQTTPISIVVAGSGGRIILNRVETLMFPSEDVTSYANVNIAANSSSYDLVNGFAENSSGSANSAIIGPTGVESGSPGTVITNTPVGVDGVDYENDLSPSLTDAIPIPFLWVDAATGNARGFILQELDVIPTRVIDLYTVINTNPQFQEFTPEMDGVDDEDPELNAPEVESPTHYLGPAAVSGPSNQVYFGEQVSSWRQILKRATRIYDIEGNGSAGGPSVCVIPQYPKLIQDLTASFLDLTNQPTNIYRWITPAYVCERGGYRIKVLSGAAGSGNPQISTCYATRIPSTSTDELGITKVFQMDVNHCGSAHGFPNLNGHFEFELPWYSNYRFLHSRNTDVRDESNFIERQLVRVGIGHSNFVRGTITYSAAEDYSVSNFLSVPVFVFVT
ncbi:TPA_asm: capsid protein precursor [Pisaster ochraceus associated picornavirus 1]|nr:TPA_asm: capsid protein precursor [Pisaster ochraceus associated picornavirus 1]